LIRVLEVPPAFQTGEGQPKGEREKRVDFTHTLDPAALKKHRRREDIRAICR
jgi:hypothetical protein